MSHQRGAPFAIGFIATAVAFFVVGYVVGYAFDRITSEVGELLGFGLIILTPIVYLVLVIALFASGRRWLAYGMATGLLGGIPAWFLGMLLVIGG